MSESICIGTEINKPESTEARAELTHLCREVAKDGVSLLAREVATNRIVGVSFNKLQVFIRKGPNLYFFNFLLSTQYLSGKPAFFDEFNKQHVHSANGKRLMTYMVGVNKKCDLFARFNADCLLEIMFLATLPEFKGRSIGKNLCQYSIELADDLRQGKNVEILPEKDRHRRPTVVSAIFSSKISQKIGDSLNFEHMATVLHADFTYAGKTFAERIGNTHPSSILVAKSLL